MSRLSLLLRGRFAPVGSAYRCDRCGRHPRWQLTRIGDVITTWACPRHLGVTAERLTGKYKVTELSVREFRFVRGGDS